MNDEPLEWTCLVCGVVHPIDHEGMFCGRCMRMVACVRCERRAHEHKCEPAVITQVAAHFEVK